MPKGRGLPLPKKTPVAPVMPRTTKSVSAEAQRLTAQSKVMSPAPRVRPKGLGVRSTVSKEAESSRLMAQAKLPKVPKITKVK